MKNFVSVLLSFLILLSYPDYLPADAGNQGDKNAFELANPGHFLVVRGLVPLAQQLGSAIFILDKSPLNEALGSISINPQLKENMTTPDNRAKLAGILDDVDTVDCVGVRMMSTQVLSFLFISTSKDGPIAIKFDIYTHKGQPCVTGFHVTTSWSVMEDYFNSVDRLEGFLHLSRENGKGTEPG